MGPGLLFLRAVDGGVPRWLRPAIVFGKVPLFYFALHVVLIHLLDARGVLVSIRGGPLGVRILAPGSVSVHAAAGLAALARGRLRHLDRRRGDTLAHLPLVCVNKSATTRLVVELPVVGLLEPGALRPAERYNQRNASCSDPVAAVMIRLATFKPRDPFVKTTIAERLAG